MALTNAKLHAGINLSKILLNYILGGGGGISFSCEPPLLSTLIRQLIRRAFSP